MSDKKAERQLKAGKEETKSVRTTLNELKLGLALSSKTIDYIDSGEPDLRGGKRQQIHSYFDDFMKEKYYEMDQEALSFDDFYTMSEQFFPHKGIPVLFRDILYNLTGYAY